MLKSMIDKGIDSSYVHMLKDYLSNRLIRLKINNSTAEKNLSRSAPQGGGLSPFLWNCDFDDMLGEYNISPNVFSISISSVIAAAPRKRTQCLHFKFDKLSTVSRQCYQYLFWGRKQIQERVVHL